MQNGGPYVRIIDATPKPDHDQHLTEVVQSFIDTLWTRGVI